MTFTRLSSKGLMISAIKDDNPVVFIDDRLLHYIEGEVPEEIYEVPIGKANILKEGKAITVEEEQQLESGVSQDFVRLSVGIENIEDIIADLDKGLNA